eukprot:TRINITY_DN3915_c0_g1_i2.p1 TRINITY_DN3915_c0_g1~~TRINITY_DN3915_c0_g1_i2.p1  ORF type:complete len:1407 (-),score=731.72 TRINITY_DN3915_c0_g1_i2:353-4573(-)
MQAQSSNIRVICRFRPINAKEKTENQTNRLGASVQIHDDKSIQIVYQKDTLENQVYTFDHVFSLPETSQQQVYDVVAKETIENVLNGYNGTIFAYGQTGSGKSFTMFGSDITSEEKRGIIPRSCIHLFSSIRADTEGTEFAIRCSFLEIYREQLRDLLNPSGESLKIRENGSTVWVEHLTEKYVTSEQEVLDLLKLGERFRVVASTNMNDVSSRSHTLFVMYIHQKSIDGSTKQGVLNLVDLAGSEKVGKTGTSGDTLEEAKKINQSLSALGNCINSLTTSKTHVPYRDSKLTHLLRESLGGNCKTTLVLAASPHKYNAEETISTLKFGQRAKTLKNKVTQNKQRSAEEMNEIIERLTRELSKMSKYAQELEKRTDGTSASSIKMKINDETEEEADMASLPLIQLQVEHQKLRESTSLQISQLQDEINSMTKNEQAHQAEVGELKKKLVTHQAALKKLKSELENSNFQNAEKLEKLQYQLVAANLKGENHDSVTSELQTTIGNLEKKTKFQEIQLENLNLELENIRRENQDHHATIQESSEIRLRLETRLKELTQENTAVQGQHVELIMENTDCRYNIVQLENELESLRQNLTEKEGIVENSKNESEISAKSLAQEQRHVIELQNQLESVKRQKDELVRFQVENENLRFQVEKLTDDSQKQIQSISLQLENERLKSIKLETMVEQLSERLKRTETEKQDMAAGSSAVNENLSKFLQEFHTMRNQDENSRESQRNLALQYQIQFEAERSNRNNLEIELKGQIAQKSEKIHNLKQEISQLRNEGNFQLENEKQKFIECQMENVKFKLKIESMTEELSRNSVEISQLRISDREREEISKKNQVLADELKILQFQLEAVKSSRDRESVENSMKIQSEAKILESKTNHISELENEIRSLQENLRNLEENFRNSRESSQKAVEDVTRQLEDSNFKLKEVEILREGEKQKSESQKISFSEKLENSEENLKEMEGKYFQLEEEHKSTNFQLENERKHFQELLKSWEEERLKSQLEEQTLHNLVQELGVKCQEFQQTSQENSAKIRDLESEVFRQQKEIQISESQLRETVEQNQRSSEQLQASIQQKDSDFGKFQVENELKLKELSENSSKFREKFETLQLTFVEVSRDKDHLEKQVTELKDQVEKSRNSEKLLEKQAEEWKERCRGISEELKKSVQSSQDFKLKQNDENSRMDEKLKNLEIELKTEKKNMERAAQEQEEISSKLRSTDLQLEELRKKAEISEKENRSLSTKSNLQEKEIKMKTDRIEQQEKRISEMSFQTEEILKKIEELTAENFKLNSDFQLQLEILQEAKSLAEQRAQEQKMVSVVTNRAPIARKKSVRSFIEDTLKIGGDSKSRDTSTFKKSDLSKAKMEGLLTRQSDGVIKLNFKLKVEVMDLQEVEEAALLLSDGRIFV